MPPAHGVCHPCDTSFALGRKRWTGEIAEGGKVQHVPAVGLATQPLSLLSLLASRSSHSRERAEERQSPRCGGCRDGFGRRAVADPHVSSKRRLVLCSCTSLGRPPHQHRSLNPESSRPLTTRLRRPNLPLPWCRLGLTVSSSTCPHLAPRCRCPSSPVARLSSSSRYRNVRVHVPPAVSLRLSRTRPGHLPGP